MLKRNRKCKLHKGRCGAGRPGRGIMTGLDMQCPASCKECEFKGARWCYIEIWSNRGAKEVPEKGRPEWCPLIDLGASEDEK